MTNKRKPRKEYRTNIHYFKFGLTRVYAKRLQTYCKSNKLLVADCIAQIVKQFLG